MDRFEFFATLLVAIFGSNGLWTFLNNRFMSKRKGKSAFEKGVIALLHDKIYDRAEKYINRDGITVDELDNLRYLYEPYEEMGGNGTGKRLYDECCKLQIISEVEANEKDAKKR